LSAREASRIQNVHTNLRVIKNKVNKGASTSAELNPGMNNIDCASDLKLKRSQNWFCAVWR
jgi:hypothetical protein